MTKRRFPMLPLYATVLVAGMTTMATEMSASRLLAPFFGTSVIVWANIIGLILIYLSIGYWYGGRVADRHPSRRGLCTVTLAAAVTIGIVPFVSRPVLELAVGGVDSLSLGTVLGSFIGTLLLFAVPITLLGMVPPYAVRLAMRDVEHAGQVSGSLYALSTIGSIIGTFGAVLVFIPLIGTRQTMLLFALALGLLSLTGLPRRVTTVVPVALLAVGAAAPTNLVKGSPGGEVLFEKDSRYQYVQVVEARDRSRLLHLNEGWAVHSIYRPQTVLTGGIWDHFLLLPSLVRGGDRRVDDMLVIGNAAGSTARAYEELYPGIDVEGVEIDPVVTDVGRRFFDMPDMPVHTADGRPFLERARGRSWDVIQIDAYKQPYIPFYLATTEFFGVVRDRLSPGGVLAINVGSAPGDETIQESIARTMGEVFPSVFRYQAEDFNEVIVALPYEASVDDVRRALLQGQLAAREETDHLVRDMVDGVEPADSSVGRVLTDDHAPVEWMTDRMIFDFATGGAGSGSGSGSAGNASD